MAGLALLAIYGIWRRPQAYQGLLTDARLRWTLAALLSAILAILFSQVLRGDIETPAYDGPLRLAISGPILLHLTQRRIDFTRMFQWVCPAAVFATAIVLLSGDPFARWHGRLSTYFVDPLTLGQYTLLFGSFCLFSINLRGKDSVWALAYKIAGVAVGFGISMIAESRSAWVALPVVIMLWLTMVLRIKSPLRLAAGGVALVAICLLIYEISPMVHMRVDAALADLQLYFHGGDKDTPVGLRLSLWRASWQLFLANPLDGYGDGHIPLLTSFPSIAPYATPTLQFIINHNGAHNELMQNLIRSGVFGLLSTVLLFTIPAVIFIRAGRSSNEQVRAAALFGLCYIGALFCFGLSTEVLNLKYLASFYGLMIAQTTAQVVWASAPHGTAGRDVS